MTIAGEPGPSVAMAGPSDGQAFPLTDPRNGRRKEPGREPGIRDRPETTNRRMEPSREAVGVGDFWVLCPSRGGAHGRRNKGMASGSAGPEAVCFGDN